MYKILIADDEAMEREALTDLVTRRFVHEVAAPTIWRCCWALI